MIINSKFLLKSTSVVTVVSDEKLAIKSANSLPEFFQEEFPTFQKFIDAYFQFQEQSKNGYKKLASIKDIDEIGDKYLTEFYKVFANRMPIFPYMGMADFIRNAKRFYTSRGSEESFRFLFRIMFGDEIEFKYPKENIFVPSSGKWVQKTSIYAKITSGSVNSSVIGKNLTIKAFDGSTSTLKVKGYIQKTANLFASGIWDDSVILDDNLIFNDLPDDFVEFEVEKFVSQNIIGGSKIFGPSGQFEADVRNTLNQFAVVNPGSDFVLGSIYTVGAITFRITAVDSSKGIKRIEFLEFGAMNDTEEMIAIANASIKLKPSAINRYSGYYDNTDGFLSNNTKLHDGFFYQIFSYVIKSKVSRELYEDIALQILHPAGLMMFSEYESSETQSVNTNTSELINVDLSPIDLLSIYDSFVIRGNFYRTVSDTISISDTITLTVGKIFSDTISLSDTGQIQYWENGTYADDGYFANLMTSNSYQSVLI